MTDHDVYATKRRTHEECLAEFERKLAEDPEMQGYINQMEKAGLRGSWVLNFLAIEVGARLKHRELLMNRRRHVRRIRKLAQDLAKIADAVEGVYADPNTYPDLLNVALESGPTKAIVSAKRVPKGRLEEMWALADDLKIMAQDLGDFFRRGGPPDAAIRAPVVELLSYVHRGTGDARPHMQILANMLHRTYEVCGIKKEAVSKESLSMLLVRHVLSSIPGERQQIPPQKNRR
jgi:hypothetical protein